MLKDLFQRLLIISPHADDEILGCGGLMARVLAEVPEAHVRVIVMGTGTVNNCGTRHQVTRRERERELARAIGVLSQSAKHGSCIDHFILYPGMELQLDRVGKYKIVDDLDHIFADFRPTAALVCYESHHQDHQITADAAIAAMRPYPSNRIPFRGLYEYGYLQAWPAPNQLPQYKLYINISEYLQLKLTAFQAYESQQRPNPADLRSLESIEAFARARGLEAGFTYAEAFWPLSITL
jgi:LmbE family N-acetylglucosaminyl deacetylase